MTRINLVNPDLLTSRHLVAEYKELTQIIFPMQRTANKGSLHTVKIPEKFSLDGGHVKFFYDKGYYLEKRFRDLYDNMNSRGIKTDPENFKKRLEKIQTAFPGIWYNDYIPNDEAYKTVIKRIKERILQKPNLYPDKNHFLTYCNCSIYYEWH
jgi:deoxyribonuclease (pyrimidine dimer)